MLWTSLQGHTYPGDVNTTCPWVEGYMYTIMNRQEYCTSLPLQIAQIDHLCLSVCASRQWSINLWRSTKTPRGCMKSSVQWIIKICSIMNNNNRRPVSTLQPIGDRKQGHYNFWPHHLILLQKLIWSLDPTISHSWSIVNGGVHWLATPFPAQ